MDGLFTILFVLNNIARRSKSCKSDLFDRYLMNVRDWIDVVWIGICMRRPMSPRPDEPPAR